MNTFVLNKSKNICKIIISGNKNNGIVIVDYDDYPLVSNHSWYIKDTSSNNPHKNYVAAKILSKTVKLHRFLLNITNSKILVDHKDRDSLNNTRRNLRLVTSRENNLNCRKSKNNNSGRTGVYYRNGIGTRSASWKAQFVDNNGKRITKAFSIAKYGNDEARLLAESARLEAEKEYNILTEK